MTDAEGRFNLTLLPPGHVHDHGDARGHRREDADVQLGLGQDAIIKVELIAAATEKVTVTGEATQIETSSNTIGQQHRPEGVRDAADRPQLLVGRAARRRASTPTRPTAAQHLDHGLRLDRPREPFLVDGVEHDGRRVRHPGQGRSTSSSSRRSTSRPAATRPSTARSTGGIINVVTKSGGNEFHGDAFGYFTTNEPPGATSRAPRASRPPTASTSGFTQEDYGADLGGYILKDRLWFFGAYDRVDNSQDTQVTIGPTSGDTTNLKTSGNLYSGKLTWHVNDSHTVIGTVFGDPTNDTGAVGPLIGPRTTYDGTVAVGGTDWGLRYEGIFGAKWLVTAQGGVHRENANRSRARRQHARVPGQDRTGLIAFGGFRAPTATASGHEEVHAHDYRSRPATSSSPITTSRSASTGRGSPRTSSETSRAQRRGRPARPDPRALAGDTRRSTSTSSSRLPTRRWTT